jgi:hypothetical protein
MIEPLLKMVAQMDFGPANIPVRVDGIEVNGPWRSCAMVNVNDVPINEGDVGVI